MFTKENKIELNNPILDDTMSIIQIDKDMYDFDRDRASMFIKVFAPLQKGDKDIVVQEDVSCYNCKGLFTDSNLECSEWQECRNPISVYYYDNINNIKDKQCDKFVSRYKIDEILDIQIKQKDDKYYFEVEHTPIKLKDK